MTADPEPRKMKPLMVRLEDDPWYDQLRIDTEPRFKTSGLSGDEWRFSYVVRVFRKGVLLGERPFGTWDWAVAGISALLLDLSDEPMGLRPEFEGLCMNPGCWAEATNVYRLVKRGCGRCGNRERHASSELAEYRRQFCDAHAKRGDSDLDDKDDNYEVITGRSPGEGEVRVTDVSESAFGGVIELDTSDER